MVTRDEARSRLTHELKSYAGAAAYLYVCLGAILLYRAAILGEHRWGAFSYGAAAIKALVLAKFLLLGEAARIGERLRPRSLLMAVVHRSVAFALLLVALSVVEEAVAGMIHGRRAWEALVEYGFGRWPEIAASCLLLWLVLVPYVAAQHLREAMGDDAWRRLIGTGKPD